MAVKPLDLSQAVSYQLGDFPPTTLDYAKILPSVAAASASLAHYDAKMASMVNADLLLAPLKRQDAISSSRMEGTFSTIEDIYRLEAEEDGRTGDPYSEGRNDDVETYLYSRALRDAQSALEKGQPLSEHLIRGAHQTLLAFGRGATKHPGTYKIEQNYIGDERSGIVQFIPISPEQLSPAMQRLVTYAESGPDLPLLRVAIAHVEFEALHPFADGNGRIGRMLITLMLWRFGLLQSPNFFVSGYFESHKMEYVERMRAVAATKDWSGWIVFFLTALHEQARLNTQTADEIIGLYVGMRERFRSLLNSQHHEKALDFVFARPVFYNDQFVDKLGIPATSARALVRRLVDAGLLRTLEPSSGRRAALYAFDPLLDLLEV